MKALNIFLKALEELFKDTGMTFIPKRVTLPSRFPAYSHIRFEVWSLAKDRVETLISSVETTDKITTPEEREQAGDKLSKETIKNILRYYGIQ